MTTASSRVASGKPGAAAATRGSASSTSTTITPTKASPTDEMSVENVRARRRSSDAISLNSGIRTPEIAPPITSSCTSCGMRVATSNASVAPERPNRWAITGSRTKPRSRLRMLPAATSAAAWATRLAVAVFTSCGGSGRLTRWRRGRTREARRQPGFQVAGALQFRAAFDLRPRDHSPRP